MKVYPVDLMPLSGADTAIVDSISQTPAVMAAMDAAWNKTMQEPELEYGFMIYTDGNSFTAGPILTGEPNQLSALVQQRTAADPLRGLNNYAVASFHTHPGNYPGAYRASNDDQAFDNITGLIAIVRTRKGFVVGR